MKTPSIFKSSIVAFGLCIIFFSCEKTDRDITHENHVVPGQNQIPPYDGITRFRISNYVNKLNIDLLGEEPTDSQRESDVDFLKEYDLNDSSRNVVITSILEKESYYDQLFRIAADLMLNGMDRKEIEDEKASQEFIADFLYSTGDSLSGQIIDNEVKELEALLKSAEDYKNDSISLNQFYARFCNNLIYDEINMGSENFVIACFENLLKRYPTEQELLNGVEMVDGQQQQLLLKNGNSKLDFIEIVVESSDFSSGRVIDAYEKLLLRKPNSEELSTAAVNFFNNKDYEAILSFLLKTDEYAGF